ncbi:TIGR03545 family protein [Halofilum ochraceum]|uniref:TIGR03545 family protein n=1 Tax=Halofilum ochraceum TaxID=1611323 RepID=UPI0008D8FF86|nr:TIGR03545 family protein [Halofilum ochraceum]
MKAIRWWGLGAFVAIVGGIVALWVSFADTLVRWGVESTGTSMVGARVELEAADVGFSPARLELRGLAVTNPDEPMRNALEAERLAFDIDWIGLLLDRVHIDEVSVEGLQFGTERETSGAVMATERTVEESGLLDKARERAEIPPLEVPSVETVLGREDLRSPELIEEARASLEKRRTALEERLADLPGEEELERYRQQIDEATEGDDAASRLKGLRQLRDLVDDIDDDRKALRRARDEVKESLAAAGDTASEARRAPQADIERLYRKYTDPGAVAGELAYYLLGPKVEQWVNQGWYWYGRLSPYLGGGGADTEAASGPETVPAARRVGRNVLYPEAGEEPRVLVRQVRVSGAAGGGDLDGRVTDIAVPPNLWGEPLRLNLAGQSVSGIDRLQVDGSMDRRDPASSISRLDLTANGTDVAGLALGPEDGILADRGQADFQVAGTIRDRALDLDVTSAIRDAAFSAGSGADSILQEVAAALGNAGRLNIGANVGGTIDAPEFELTSSLTGILEPLLRSRLQAEAGEFREGLVAAVKDRTGGSLEELEASSAKLNSLEQELEGRLEGFRKVLDRARKPLD